MRRIYTNFEEIDRDLKILRLKREIAAETLQLQASETKKSLYPTQLLGGFSGVIQKLLLSLAVKKLMERFSR